MEGLALRRPPPRIAEVHRAVCAVATGQGWPVPSYEVVRRIVHRLNPGLVALADHDPETPTGTVPNWCCAAIGRRERSVAADHTELDVMVLNELGKPARPWLTVILDDIPAR